MTSSKCWTIPQARVGSDATKGLQQGSGFVAKNFQAVNVRPLNQLCVPNGHDQEETRAWEFSSKKKTGDGDLCELDGGRSRWRN